MMSIARGDHAQMTGELHFRARKLLDHYRSHGMFTTETARPEALAQAGQEVIWALDYVSLAGDLEHCLKYCESHVRTSADCKTAELRVDKSEVESILLREVPAEELVKMLVDLAENLSADCASLGGTDLFYYELACGSRTLIEVCTEMLKRHGGEGQVPNEIRASVSESESRMRAVLEEIQGKYPSLERPFPPCPEYTPESYWWYLR